MSGKISSCLFCGIAHKQISCVSVFESAELIAFLDTSPIRRGHVQFIPRDHFDYFDDLPADLAGQIIRIGQEIARALKKLYGVDRVAFLFSGGDIPHAHAHVVPMHEKTDITSRLYIAEDALTFRPTPKASLEELEAVAGESRSTMELV
ncbi:HIT family protein [Agrobacterium rhizogenes]|uniref:HIT family protein n=1 Tax=Rhizobium rhizogenes TaxID=359 RepID=UPI00157296A5|nr:HIT family protein [Rhizobium rhizogenes]NTH25658.1 HIT family protein [Rhizobium rhizogenes]